MTYLRKLDAAPRRAILFDVDGTLVDSNGSHAHAWSDACAEFGIARSTAFFAPLIGMGGDRVLPLVRSDLTDETSPGKDISHRRSEIFRERYFPSVKATSGARLLVERLHQDGWICAVATSATKVELEAMLRLIGIEAMIHVAADGDDANSSKPAPDIVLAALDKAKVDASCAVLLGDTPYDVEAAKGAGVAAIALRCGGRSDDDLRGSVEIYDDPAALLGTLGS